MDWSPTTVVVGVDGSEESHKAVELAASVARQWNAGLKIVTVIRTPEGWWGIGGAPPSPEALSDAIVRGREEILNSIEARHDFSGIDFETVQEVGDPFSRLVAVCEETDADLLVIGRRGSGLAERVILGSTADRLTHHAPCPVLVVP
jgi:nucleotide-binding universal stress UspA family protein